MALIGQNNSWENYESGRRTATETGWIKMIQTAEEDEAPADHFTPGGSMMELC